MEIYLIQVWGGVEPELFGPYATEVERDEDAKGLFGDEHAVFKLYVEDGIPSLGSYTGGEVDDLMRTSDHVVRESDGDSCHEPRGGDLSGSEGKVSGHCVAPDLDPAAGRDLEPTIVSQVTDVEVVRGSPDAPDGRAYFKTVYQVMVLSDEPHEFDGDLHEIAYDIDQGQCVGDITLLSTERITRRDMDRLLVEVGSSPGLFPDEDGDDLPA